MKNKFLTGITFLLCIATLSVKAIETDRIFSGYDIVQVSEKELDYDVDKAWVLSYDDNESSIMISLHQNKRSKYYVVRTDYFEVAYECCKSGFGASRIKLKYRKVPYKLSSRIISAVELQRQKILTDKQVSEEKALELIAAYLPDLVNSSYKHLL